MKTNLKKKNMAAAKKFFAVMVFVLISGTAFAAIGDASGITSLDNVAEKVEEATQSKVVVVILTIAVIVCFAVMAWGNSQGEGGMIKKVLPVIFALGGVGAAGGIVMTVMSWGASA